MELIVVVEERLLRTLQVPRPGGGGTRKLDISFFSVAAEQLLPSLLLPDQHKPGVLGIASPLTYPPQKRFRNRWVLGTMNDSLS